MRRAQSLGVLRPALVLELHPERNGALDPYAIGVRSGRKLWWRCAACGHDWQAAPHERSRGGGCPRCAQEKRNAANRHVTNERSLAVKRPDLVAELHPSLNLELDAYTLGAGSGQLVWWLCRVCGHAGKAAAASRARGRGCPRCGRQRTAAASARSKSRVPPERSLARKRPELAHELHPTRNRELDPLALAPYSNREIWWLCPTCGNEWKTRPQCARGCGKVSRLSGEVTPVGGATSPPAKPMDAPPAHRRSQLQGQRFADGTDPRGAIDNQASPVVTVIKHGRRECPLTHIR